MTQHQPSSRLGTSPNFARRRRGLLLSAGLALLLLPCMSCDHSETDATTSRQGIRIHSAEFDPSNSSHVLVSDGMDVSVFDLESVDSLGPNEMYSLGTPANDASFSPDATTIATAHADGTVQLWKYHEFGLWGGYSVRGDPIRAHEDEALCVMFSPDGSMLVSAGRDATVRLWNIDGTPHGDPIRGHVVSSLQFSPDGQLFATGGVDGTVQLWNLDGTVHGEPIRTEGDQPGQGTVTFSPDGQLFATGRMDGSVQLWNLDGTAYGEPIQGHNSPVTSVQFSPDGQLLASADQNATVWLSTLDGLPYGPPIEHRHTQYAHPRVVFAPNGRMLSLTTSAVVEIFTLDGSEHEEFTNIWAHSGREDDSEALGFIDMILTITLLAVFAAFLAGVWMTFAKAGKPGWAALVPIYNLVLLLRITDRPMWWILPILACILATSPFVLVLLFYSPTLFFTVVILGFLALFVFSLLVSLALAEKFGRDTGFGIGLAVLPFVFYPLLGFGEARFRG